MSPVAAITSCHKHYFDFRTRASRSEFWWFWGWFGGTLIALIWMAEFLTTPLGSPSVGTLIALIAAGWALAHVIPYLAVQARRLHDWDRTGWWLVLHLVGIGSLVLLLMMLPGTKPHRNRWGPPASA